MRWGAGRRVGHFMEFRLISSSTRNKGGRHPVGGNSLAFNYEQRLGFPKNFLTVEN